MAGLEFPLLATAPYRDLLEGRGHCGIGWAVRVHGVSGSDRDFLPARWGEFLPPTRQSRKDYEPDHIVATFPFHYFLLLVRLCAWQLFPRSKAVVQEPPTCIVACSQAAATAILGLWFPLLATVPYRDLPAGSGHCGIGGAIRVHGVQVPGRGFLPARRGELLPPARQSQNDYGPCHSAAVSGLGGGQCGFQVDRLYL